MMHWLFFAFQADTDIFRLPLLIDAATTFHFHATPMIATHAMLPAVMLLLLLMQRFCQRDRQRLRWRVAD
jgi:hypothetical protein